MSLSPPTDAVCKTCTLRLEMLCYRRAWWFRAFREVLASGVRLFALFHQTEPADFTRRSAYCHGCLRFKKNALKQRSPLFRRLDALVNPVFNRVRDSLLTEQELEEARRFAAQAADARMELATHTTPSRKDVP